MSQETSNSRQERLLHLQTVNAAAWQGNLTSLTTKNLDANIKKNTGFIKKCKTNLGADSCAQLLNEIKTLQLKKYLTEITSAIVEGLFKCSSTSDANAAVDVISALHQRFGAEFTSDLTSNLIKLIHETQKLASSTATSEQKEKDENLRQTKLKIYLRIIGEMYLCGLLFGIDELDIPEAISSTYSLNCGLPPTNKLESVKLKEISRKQEFCTLYGLIFFLVENDSTQHVNLQVITHFAKTFKREFELDFEDNPNPDSNSVPINKINTDFVIIKADHIAGIKNLIENYWKTGINQLEKMINALKKLETKNKELLYTRGTISDDKKQKYELWSKKVEKIKSNMEAFSECIGKKMPQIKMEADESTIGISFDNPSTNDRDEATQGWWADEEEKQFYTQLFDLRSQVPPVYLENIGAKKKKQGVDEKKKPSKDNYEESEFYEDFEAQDYEEFIEKRAKAVLHSKTQVPLKNTLGSDPDRNPDTKEDISDFSGTAGRLDTLLSQLPSLANRERTDEACVEYCYASLKSGHKRVIKTLLDVPKKRQDLLPFYSRFIATLDPFMPSIGASVVEGLESEFRWFIRKKIRNLFEARARNAKYISELTKFKVAPPYIAIRCCKVLVESFVPQDIEILCTFIEECGRFLLSGPESGPRMTQILETLLRKRTALNLETVLVNLIDSVYLQLYRQLRKLPWNNKTGNEIDEDSKNIHEILIKCFSKPHKIKFALLPVLAMLSGMLSRSYPWFGIRVVDTVLENIRLGLETNLFVYNQRRISDIKYIGELYNFRMIDFMEIFEVLYLLLNYGYTPGNGNEASVENIPYPGKQCPVDLSTDYFRIRLVCTLLATCGNCFEEGHDKAYLDIYLAYFELYILSKDLPLPIDMKFMVDEIYSDLRPNLPLHSTWKEAVEVFEATILENMQTINTVLQKTQKNSKVAGVLEEKLLETDVIMDTEILKNDTTSPELVPGENNINNGANSDNDEDGDGDGDDYSDKSINSRKLERVVPLDMGIPVHLRDRKPNISSGFPNVATNLDDDANNVYRTYNEDGLIIHHPPEKKVEPNIDVDGVRFSLLTGKKQKPQIKNLLVPESSKLALRTRAQQIAARQEKERLNQLVLSYEKQSDPFPNIGSQPQKRYGQIAKTNILTSKPNDNDGNLTNLGNTRPGPRNSQSSTHSKHPETPKNNPRLQTFHFSEIFK
ncbi:hypothetical protein BB558_005010 [Smittium angustum]|uniref:MIF4G domain-containing protein n=1 Tax=Smittium angustum TaxID=133377 RepID=A0A2U1J1N2_SMIAN|nr:hypothetical protein BB558_005010 [Smittium angustum]